LDRPAFGVLLLLSLAAVVWLALTEVISPSFGYIAREASIFEWIFAFIGSGVLVFLTPRHRDRVSSYVFVFLSATIGASGLFVPMLFGDFDTSSVLLTQLSFVVGFAIVRSVLLIPRLSVKNSTARQGADSLFLAAIIAVSAGCLVVLFVVYGLRPSFFTLSEVYDAREEYNEAISGVGRYIVGNLANAILPVGICWSAYKRSWAAHWGLIACYLLLYSMTGFRSYFVAVALMVCAIHGWRYLRSRRFLIFAVFVASSLLALVWDKLVGGIDATSLLVRRAIATAGKNTLQFVDFFSANEPYGLAAGVLGDMSSSPYPYGAPTLIALTYSGREFAANANFVADGWATLGLLGVVLMSAIAGFYFWAIDVAADRIPWVAAVPAVVPIATSFSNTSALTIMLSHGGLLLLLLMLLAPTRPADPERSSKKSVKSSSGRF